MGFSAYIDSQYEATRLQPGEPDLSACQHGKDCGEGREYCIPCEECRTMVCDQHRVSVVFEDGSSMLCFACAGKAFNIEDGADALERKLA